MNRRQALQASFATILASGMPSPALAGANSTQHPSIQKPRRLRKGDTVGLITPASNASENEGIRFAIDVVRSLGFEVVEGKYLYARNQYLAGTDLERAEDVNSMFANDDVDAIFCLRGGYGTARILPYLDYDLIADNPKVFLGYSDITAILSAIHKKTGLVGFHGPIAKQNFTDYTLTEYKKILVNPADSTIIGQPPAIEKREGYAEQENRITVVAGGTATGRLTGGNLSLVASLIGTPYEPEFRDRILFLEDVDESPYSVDRMLTQLWLAGKLDQVAGIAMGKFTDIGDSSGNTYSMEQVIHMRCEPLGVPVIKGLMIGHIEDQTVVPIGINAELDADSGTLRILEPAVI